MRVASLPPLRDILDDYELLEGEDRYRLLIDLGRQLEPMPDALKTDATKVRGCAASVWVYPRRDPDGRLHFLADSNAAITKGIVALVLAAESHRDEHVERLAHERCSRMAEEPLGLRVDEHDPSPVIGQDERVGRRLDHRLELQLHPFALAPLQEPLAEGVAPNAVSGA